MIKPEKLLLIIGNARSGSTILGAVLDAHPNMVIANETVESSHLWRGMNGEQILKGIFQNAEQQAFEASRSAVCGHKSQWKPTGKQTVRVVGDKVWNPATLLLHGNYKLIPSLEERVGAPVIVIHACRNPYDVISTMQSKSGASLRDRIRWYSAHCEAVAAVSDRMPPERFLHVFHEELIWAAASVLRRCCKFLDVPFSDEYLRRCNALLFENPRQTRQDVTWSPDDSDRVDELIKKFPWLSIYSEGECERWIPSRTEDSKK